MQSAILSVILATVRNISQSLVMVVFVTKADLASPSDFYVHYYIAINFISTYYYR